MQLQKTYTSRGDGHYPAAVNEWFYGVAANFSEGITVTHAMIGTLFMTPADFTIASESEEEIGEYHLSMVYSLPDFRNPEIIIDTFTTFFNITVTKCEPIDLKHEGDLPSSEYLIKYLANDPPELTLPTWKYNTLAGVAQSNPELLCNATFTHEVFAVDVLSSGVWKTKNVDREWTKVENFFDEPMFGPTQKVAIVKYELNQKLEE